MKYICAFWLCIVLVHSNVATDKDAAVVGAGTTATQEDPVTSILSDMIADLHRIYNGKTDNLHLDLNKRSTLETVNGRDTEEDKHPEDASDVATGDADSEEEDTHGTGSMATLHRVYNGKVENLQTGLHKSHPVSKKRNPQVKAGTVETEEDPFAASLSHLMSDLHSVYNGRIENLHADLNKRRDSPTLQNVHTFGNAGDQEDPFVSSLSNMMSDLHRMYAGKIENLHADFNKRLLAQDRRYANLEKKYDHLLASISSTFRTPRQSEEAVAFYVQLGHTIDHLGNYQPIVFDQVTTNIGNAYNVADGIFTAPRAGVYVFSWTTYNDVHSHMMTELVQNNVVKGRTWSDAYDHDDVAIASNTVVLTVAKADTVWIRSSTTHSGIIMGSQMSTFCGWLLY